MATPAIVHILGEDAILADLDTVPNPTHQFLLMRNVRKKDGKPLAYIADEAQVILYAWHKITFLELMVDVQLPESGAPATVGTVNTGAAAANGQKPAGTAVLGFFRDDES
jgi:hypothetical protein